MAVPFPYPGDNWTSILDMFNYANDLTGGYLGIGILLVVGLISFIATPKRGSISASFAFSSFLLLITSILLRIIHLISDTVFYVVVIITIASMVYLGIKKEEKTP
jgi:hypothetical protein